MVTATFNKLISMCKSKRLLKGRFSFQLFLHGTNERVKTTFKLVQHYTRKLLGHRDQTPRPEAPAEVLDSLEALCRTWQRDYANVLPCPTYAFILKNSDRVDRVPTLCKWMYDLQVHRLNCLQYVQERIPQSKEGF